jgi:dihydroorotate dehydrogenase (fumarate)
MVRRLEDAGAAAITMHSLFEEQIAVEREATWRHLDIHEDGHAEATTYFPKSDEYRLGPDKYLEQIRRIKQAVAVPVIASLNGTTGRGWVEYAQAMHQAGADALELNVYMVATDPAVPGGIVDQKVVDAAHLVRSAVSIPVAVKLSPFFSSIAHLAQRLDAAGVNGLVLFNRFYQPDIDIEHLDVVPHLRLSDSSELLLRLRWLAILSGRLKATLACSGGVHTAARRIRALDGRARVRVGGADARQHEPWPLPGSGGLRTRQLREAAADVAAAVARCYGFGIRSVALIIALPLRP